MAIKSVNGKNVYVIDVEVPTPRTSTGQSYGNLVSDLRWDLYDRIQKDIMNQAEIQKLGYKAQLELYQQQKKEYDDRIARLKDLKLKTELESVEGGGKNRIADLAIAQSNIDKKVLEGSEIQVTSSSGQDKYTWNAAGKGSKKKFIKTATTYGKSTVKESKYAPGSEAAKRVEQGLSPIPTVAERMTELTQGAKAAEGGAPGASAQLPAFKSIDEEIAALEEARLGLTAPKYEGITDFTGATNKAFADRLGYGGFGINPRLGKYQSTYDQPAAIKAIDASYEDAKKTVLKDAKSNKAYKLGLEQIDQKAKRDIDLLFANGQPSFIQGVETPAHKQNMRIAAEINDRAVKEKAALTEKFKAGLLSANLTADEMSQMDALARQKVVDDARSMGARSVSRRGFLGYETPDFNAELPAREPRVREPRVRLNPPGTDRPDAFFKGPRGVGASQVEDLNLDPQLSDVSEKVTVPDTTLEDSNIEQKFRNYSAETPGLYTGPGPAGLRSRAAGSNYVNTDVPVLSGPSKVDIAAEDLAQAIAAEEEAAIYGESDPATRQAAAAREAEFRALLGEDYQQMPRPPGARSSSRQAAVQKREELKSLLGEDYNLKKRYLLLHPTGRMEPSPPAQMPIESRGGEAVPAWRRPAGLADRLALRNLAREQQASQQNEGPSVGAGRTDLPPEYDIGSEEDIKIGREKPIISEPADQSKAPATRDSRRDLYLARTIKKGIQLANKPAKVERLAKTNLPEKERVKAVPEAIAVVDKIYEINRGKPNAFKLSFDEISRAFANRPTERQQAHEYLVAKDMLEGDRAKPLA